MRRSEHVLGLVEQVPAPVDHRAQRLVARQRRTAAAGEQPEPVVQAAGDLRRGHRAQAGGGQLDRQRHAVEPAADGEHRAEVGLDGEAGPHGGAPVGQQAYGRIVEHFLDGDARVVVRERQRRHRPQRLPRDAERLAAGGEDAHARAVGQDAVGEPGARVDQVLAVVQHDQQPLVGQRGHEPPDRVGAGRRRTPHRCPSAPARAGRARSAAPAAPRPGRRPGPARPARHRRACAR